MVDSQLTPRQQQVLDFIRSCSVPPTVREIGKHLGIDNPEGTYCHLRALKKKGLLLHGEKNKSRNIRVAGTEKQITCPHCGQSFVAEGSA